MGVFLVGWLLLVVPSSPMVGQCKAGPVEVEAQRLLDALDAALKAGDAEEMKALWKAVEGHACFALPLLETYRQPWSEEVEAFQIWWERGGRNWLASGLSTSMYTVVPPDAPNRPKLNPAGGLARLLCPKGASETCGRETAGWGLRAAQTLEPHQGYRNIDARKAIEAACADEAHKAKKQDAYRAWRECLEAKRPLGAAMPLGRFQAPKEGWLVLRGRRGHYEFCDEVRVYDLVTGGAWVAQSCSGLVLQRGGFVDHDATDANRGAQVRVGQLPVEALREAAWMTLLAPHVTEHVQPRAWFVRRPLGLTPEWPRDDVRHGVSLGGFWGSSAQTKLSWSWDGKEGLRDEGTLTWPNSAAAGEDYAVALWRIAEAAFIEGCAPAGLPPQLVVGSKAEVSSLDAKQSALDATEQQLVDALYRHPDGCADGK